jgi:hypothetical protein
MIPLCVLPLLQLHIFLVFLLLTTKVFKKFELNFATDQKNETIFVSCEQHAGVFHKHFTLANYTRCNTVFQNHCIPL